MTQVNMGDTPATAISTEAVYKTADMFQTDSPKAANLLKRSSYVDDLIDSQLSTPEALKVTRESCEGRLCSQALTVYWRIKSLHQQNVV